VIKEFTDYDGIVHPRGETWTFETTNFVPYESGLTLHVNKDGKPVVYRLLWVTGGHDYIIEHPPEFIESCS
jgi:hypothetical protein